MLDFFKTQEAQTSHRDTGGDTKTAPRDHAGDPAERLLGLDILIVEDEAMLALDLSYAVEDAGAEVREIAYSLASALALVSQAGFHVDAAILDVDLGGSDVFPVAERLTALDIPFLFHTGHGDRRHLTSLFPGAAVCIKPTLQDELIETLQALVARARR